MAAMCETHECEDQRLGYGWSLQRASLTLHIAFEAQAWNSMRSFQKSRVYVLHLDNGWRSKGWWRLELWSFVLEIGDSRQGGSIPCTLGASGRRAQGATWHRSWRGQWSFVALPRDKHSCCCLPHHQSLVVCPCLWVESPTILEQYFEHKEWRLKLDLIFAKNGVYESGYEEIGVIFGRNFWKLYL